VRWISPIALCAACAGSQGATELALRAPAPMAHATASVTPSAPDGGDPEGGVTVSLFYAGRSVENLELDASAVAACRAARPLEAGWVTFAVNVERNGELQVVTRLDWEGLSQDSVACVERALRVAKVRQLGVDASVAAYVTFR
jgi:hypothetical protein